MTCKVALTSECVLKFHSCLLSALAFEWKRGLSNFVLIQTLLLFTCKSCPSFAHKFHIVIIYMRKAIRFVTKRSQLQPRCKAI